MRTPRLGSARREDVRAGLVALAALGLMVGVLSAVASGDGDPNVVAGAPPDAAALPIADGDSASAAAGTHEHGDAASDTAAHDHGDATTEAAHDDTEHLHGTTGSDDGAAAHAHADGTAAHDDAAAHDDGHSHDTTPTVAGSPTTTHGDHAHETPPTDAGSPPTTHGDHAHTDPPPTSAGSPPTTAHNHPPTPTGPIVSITDPRLTAAQQTAAQTLLDQTISAMARYPDVKAVQDAGYVWIGDGAGAGFEHYVNWAYLDDGRELDSSRIESVVVQRLANGTKQVASAMYILESTKTMADVPDIAGELTTWHNHQNLCWNGNKLAGTLVNGVCKPGGVLRVTPPMLHVWLAPHACGPFHGVEGHGSTDCGHSH